MTTTKNGRHKKDLTRTAQRRPLTPAEQRSLKNAQEKESNPWEVKPEQFRKGDAMKNPHAVALGRKGGKVGGKAKTEAKVEAARLNGRKGGRPPNKKRSEK